MEDMDIDFDLERDPIADFLLHQLEQAKLKNTILLEKTRDREELLKYCLEKTVKFDGKLKIVDVWRRTFNNKFVIGIRLLNDSSNIQINDVILNWDSSSFISYTSKVFTKLTEGIPPKAEWISTHSFSSSATVVLAIEKPDFTRQDTYNINGIMKYEQSSEEFQLLLPELTISAHELNDLVMEVRNFSLLKGDEEAFLTYQTASEEFHLVGMLERWQRNIGTLLVIDCMFKELDVVSKNKIFLVDGISSIINGCLVEISDVEDGMINFKISTQNEEQLMQLLHYIYKNVGDIALFPKSHEMALFKTKSSQSFRCDSDIVETRKALGKSLIDEILLINKFHGRTFKGAKAEEYVKFRLDLNKLEYKTDQMFAKNLNL